MKELSDTVTKLVTQEVERMGKFSDTDAAVPTQTYKTPAKRPREKRRPVKGRPA